MKEVMIVDDDQDIRESIGMVLKINGYNVLTAKNAEDCLQKLNSFKPDLILLDIMMPGMGVSELVKKIKDTKIAFMSIVRESDAKNRGLCDGENIVGYFQKPFNVDELISKIEIFLKD